MSARPSAWTWTRRIVQVGCLLLFLGLFLKTRLQIGAEPSAGLKLFFWIDPLVLIFTWLATYAVPAVLCLSLITIFLTLIFGRAFCGWVCPLGTIHAAAGWLIDRVWPNRKRRDHWSPWQRTKYYILGAGLLMALLGCEWITTFDPLVLLFRSCTTSVLPGAQWAVDETWKKTDTVDPGIGPVRAKSVTGPVHDFFHKQVVNVEGASRDNPAFYGAGLIFVVFVGLIAANAYRRRFWCRYLCPLGGLLGIFSLRPLLRRKTGTNCNQCDLCAANCHGACAEPGATGWTASECYVCMNCPNDCRRDAMSFRFVTPWKAEPVVEGPDLTLRAMMASAAGGLAALWTFRASPSASPTRAAVPTSGQMFQPRLIRPPGARQEKEFLQRCTGCGMCIKICPTGALHPTLLEAGLEGLWTPRLVPRVGPCDQNCNLCGQVCPTEAIRPLPLEEKQKTKLGLAMFDTTRCLPYAYGRDCMVCEEQCPIADKAIYFLEVEIQDREGQKRKIKQPHVDPDKCTGCGVCEYCCVYRDEAAVRVVSANETRNSDNQCIL